MLKIAILASTSATDLQALIDSIEKKEVRARISVVISNRENAYALERARRHGIEAVFLDVRGFAGIEDRDKKREMYDMSVSEVIDRQGADLILLIGYMRILSQWFVRKYRNKIMNIHPSLLPEFSGKMDMDVHQAVLDARKKKTGCTLHFVSEVLDGGPVIFQKEVMVEREDDAVSLRKKVQKAEQGLIVKAIKLYSKKKIRVAGGKVVILDNHP